VIVIAALCVALVMQQRRAAIREVVDVAELRDRLELEALTTLRDVEMTRGKAASESAKRNDAKPLRQTE
jgi:hypothetical protein